MTEHRYPVKFPGDHITHYVNEEAVRALHADLSEILEGIAGKIQDHHDGDDGNDFPTYLEDLEERR